jgi:hypothetical protein
MRGLVVDVDRSADISLEALAAGRDITICFTDLDGADGLWLPEERTILLGQGLSKRRAAEVLQHELSHVDIEDGHAALDAAVHRHVGRIRWTVATTAAASIALLVGFKATQTHPQRIADSRPVPAAVAPTSTSQPAKQAVVRAPVDTKVIRIDGVRTETVTVTPPVVAATPLSTPDTGATATSTTPGVAEVTSTSQQSPSTPATPNTPTETPTTPKVSTSSTPPTDTTTPPVDTSASNSGGFDSTSPSLVGSSEP